MTPLPETVIADTRRWLERAVIGLNLCPFAKAVYAKGQVHFVVCAATSRDEILGAVERELADLAAHLAQQRDTTLIILSAAMDEFLEFSALMPMVDRLLRRNGWEGQFQVANFHPDFQFADAQAEDIANATNRSPYPILHLLREESIDRAVDAFPEADAIYEANVERLRALGPDGWAALQVGRS